MKCLACGVEKDREVLEAYPYPEDGLISTPIDPLFDLDVEPWEDVHEVDRKWREVTVCHTCFHKLSPDHWISSECWKSLGPVTPFEQLPLMED